MRRLTDDTGGSALPVMLAEASQARRSLVLVAALTLLAKGAALLPGYAIDDWGASVDGPGGLLTDVLGKGRLGHWLFLQAVMALQAEPNTARILYVSAAIAAYAFFGWAVVRFWRLPDQGWLPVVAAAMIANHPYTSEIFTFRIGLPLAAIVVLLLTFLLYEARQTTRLWLGALVFAFALSCYQIALHFGLMVVLTSAALALSRRLRTDGPAATAGETDDGLWRATRQLSGFLALGTLLYVAIGRLLGRAMVLSDPYFRLLRWQLFPARLRRAAGDVWHTLFDVNVLIPPLARALFAVLALCLLAGLLWGVARSRSKSAVLLAPAVGAILGAALLWSVGVFLALDSYGTAPRAMAHIGIFWAVCAVLAVELAPWRWATRALAVTAGLIVVSFIGVNQHVFEEQRRLNVRDLLLANRVVARLESMPGFERVRDVAVVGGFAWYPIGLQRTQWGDLNISAFAPTWSRVALLREASGYPLRVAEDGAEQAAARDYCSSAALWPAPGSVVLRDQLAIICIARPPVQ